MFNLQYINMRKEAKDEIEHIRIFTPGGELRCFHFKPGDYFHHPAMGGDGARELKMAGASILRAVDDPWPYDKDGCIWLPTAGQLIKETESVAYFLPDKSDMKSYFSETYFSGLSDEERVLAYFMEHREGKLWDFENQRWICNKQGTKRASR